MFSKKKVLKWNFWISIYCILNNAKRTAIKIDNPGKNLFDVKLGEEFFDGTVVNEPVLVVPLVVVGPVVVDETVVVSGALQLNVLN